MLWVVSMFYSPSYEGAHTPQGIASLKQALCVTVYTVLIKRPRKYLIILTPAYAPGAAGAGRASCLAVLAMRIGAFSGAPTWFGLSRAPLSGTWEVRAPPRYLSIVMVLRETAGRDVGREVASEEAST